MERFDVLLSDASNGATIEREWSKDELLRSVGWLKRMNARGRNIFIRPSGPHGLALLPSLGAENLARMRRSGFTPTISIELNSCEFQAWVKLSDVALPDRIRRLAEAGLVREFGGLDKQATGSGYGRLAGCVNQSGITEGRQPGRYLLAHPGDAVLSKRASAYVEHLVAALRDRTKEQEPKTEIQVFQASDRLRPRDR